MSIGDSLAHIPGHLVAKIQAGEYIDFAELLPDNRELLCQLEVTEIARANPQSISRRKLRQINSITMWAQCFFVFCVVYLDKFPEKHTNLMAYGKMIMQEAARHKGDGWLVYDMCFRQQMENGNRSNSVLAESK